MTTVICLEKENLSKILEGFPSLGRKKRRGKRAAKRKSEITPRWERLTQKSPLNQEEINLDILLTKLPKAGSAERREVKIKRTGIPMMAPIR